MSTSGKADKRSDEERKLAIERRIYPILAGAVVVILATGTIVYHYLEGWSWVDAFYFTAVAGSTVGFGDLAPTSDGSKLFTILYIFSAITIIGTFLDQRLKYHGVVRKQAKKAIQVPADDESGSNT
jgi:hypothetical protein